MSAFNQKPIIITTAMPLSFWNTLRAAGVLAATQGKPIEVISITWTDMGPNADYTITDGMPANTVLQQGNTGPDYIGGDKFEAWPSGVKRWRDWQVTQLNGGTLQIDYR